MEKQEAELIGYFVKQAEEANNVDSLVHVIILATSHPFLFNFSEISSVPTFDQLQGTESSGHLDLLLLFAHGTWNDYKSNAGRYPQLAPAQTLKLKQLALLTLDKAIELWSYDPLIQVLDVADDSELESLINESMRVGIVGGKLYTSERCAEVKLLAGRDLIPGQLEDIFGTRANRLEAGKLGPEKSVKRRMVETVELADALAPKHAGGREERVRKDVASDQTGTASAVDSSAPIGSYKMNDIVLFECVDSGLTIKELVSPYLFYAQDGDDIMYAVHLYQSKEEAERYKEVHCHLKSEAFPRNMNLGKLDDTWSLAVEHETDPLEDWITRVKDPYVIGYDGKPADINPNIKLVLRGIAEALLELLLQKRAYGLVRTTIRIDRATQKPLMLGTFIEGTQANYNHDMKEFHSIISSLSLLGLDPPCVLTLFDNLYAMSNNCHNPTTTWEFAKYIYQNPLTFDLAESISFMDLAGEAFYRNKNWVKRYLNLQSTLMFDWQKRALDNFWFKKQYNLKPDSYRETYHYARFRHNMGAHRMVRNDGTMIEDSQLEKWWTKIFPESYFVIYNEVVKVSQEMELR